MSANPPPSQLEMDTQESPDIITAYSRFKHTAAIALLIGAPILIAIPPRKLDLYTFSLAGAFVASANQLTVERTGKGLIGQFSQRYAHAYPNLHNEDVAPRKEVLGNDGMMAAKRGSLLEEKVKADWKEERLKEEQEKLNDGEGYGGMIMDQIWAVWNQEGRNKKSGGSGEEK